MEDYASSEVIDNDFYGLEEEKGLDDTEHTADPLLLDLFPNPQEDFPEFSEEFPVDDAGKNLFYAEKNLNALAVQSRSY